MAESKTKLRDKDKFVIWVSMLGGLAIGLIGNLVVTATFRWIDNPQDRNTIIGYIASWVAFLIIFSIIWKAMSKLHRSLR